MTQTAPIFIFCVTPVTLLPNNLHEHKLLMAKYLFLYCLLLIFFLFLILIFNFSVKHKGFYAII